MKKRIVNFSDFFRGLVRVPLQWKHRLDPWPERPTTTTKQLLVFCHFHVFFPQVIAEGYDSVMNCIYFWNHSCSKPLCSSINILTFPCLFSLPEELIEKLMKRFETGMPQSILRVIQLDSLGGVLSLGSGENLFLFEPEKHPPMSCCLQ